MKISEQWLREWIPMRLTTAALAERLTMAGIEIGGISPVAPDLKNIVVGEIISAEPHPQADRLRLCSVNIGKSQRLAIVCGASNAAAGLRVPVALVGAVLPNGTEIKRAAIRGVESHGMLCSAAELGLAESSEGLFVLDRDARPGTAFTSYLGLKDNQLEVELTPNRGDCLSIAGLARELSALTGDKLKAPPIWPVSVKSTTSCKVAVQAKQDCPHYAGRVIEGLDPNAVTPLWMCERLRRGGVRSIHPVVDVTNYVMLELGQPMHAFDLDRLSGGIRVRHALKNESLELLDGSKAKLAAGTLLIADAKKPLALAGIMGGMESAVSAATTRIFLESACFHPETISMRARSLGMHTDSSHRFERGVDPALQRLALERASALILAIAGGKAGPVTEQKSATHMPARKPVLLRRERMAKLLGANIADKDIVTILKRLGMPVAKAAAGWRVTPPSWRYDISRECDLIEEVARVTGYENLPQRSPVAVMRMGSAPEGRVTEDRLRQILIDRDYQEAVTYSFIDPVVQALLDPEVKPRALANPISSDMAVMRTSLWPGLLGTIQYNQNRQQTRMRLFEIGRRFLPAGRTTGEDLMLAGAISGPRMPKQWGIGERVVDFYDAKGDVEALIAATGRAGQVRFQPAQHPALHPGQGAKILDENGHQIGLLGALHPAAQAELGLDRPVYLFELRLDRLGLAKIPVFRELSRFPAIRRDLALVVAERTPAQAIMDNISHNLGHLLVNLELFDEYRGEGIDSGRKSLALGLTLQDSSRTLKEEEIEVLMTKVIGALVSDLGAQLRQ
jgi:phenylalanyl-tRNA synthetase beta chain